MINKKYLNIREVSKILGLEEHVIRYWDSVDPKTQKLRVDGLSTKSKGGTRYFNKENMFKLKKIKNLLYENGTKNYSLNIANKILSSRKDSKNYKNPDNFNKLSNNSKNTEKISQILENMRILVK